MTWMVVAARPATTIHVIDARRKASGADEATPMLSAMNPESEPQPGE